MKRLNEILTVIGMLLAVLGVAVLPLTVRPSDKILAGPPDDVPNPETILVSAARFDRRTIIGVTWGPSYYATDQMVELGTNRDSLNLATRLDPQAITGVKWGPAYYANDEIAVIQARP